MKQIKQKIKAIIFDMDGTIIHSEHIWAKSNLHVLGKRGITHLTPEQEALLETFSGIGTRAAMTILKNEFNLADTVDALCKEAQHTAVHEFSHTIEFVKGFAFFHKLLQEHNIPTALATNSDIESLKTLTEKLGLAEFFGVHLYSIGHIGNKAKPDPAVFLHAAEKLGVKPEECLVFEDSLFGLQAAHAAGMKVIAIKNERNACFLDNAHHAIDHYHQAEDAVRAVVDKYFTEEK